LLVILVLIGIGVGYLQGFLRQIMGLLSLYVGLVMAAYFHLSLERWMDFLLPEMAEVVRGPLAFLLILALTYGLLDMLSRRAFPQTKLAALGLLDQLGGMVVGFLTVGVQIGVGALILQFLTGAPWWLQGEKLRQNLALAIQSSILVPFFYHYLTLVARAVLPWIPGGLPTFLYPGL
jgi:uncharacterized membrane protein required for colicin V production